MECEMSNKEENAIRKFIVTIKYETPGSADIEQRIRELKSRLHPLKENLKGLPLRQADLAIILGIQHLKLNRYLNGYEKMPENIAKQLETIITLYESKG